VFSPNTLAGAPHNLLATITLPKSEPVAVEAKLAQQTRYQAQRTHALSPLPLDACADRSAKRACRNHPF